MIFSSSDILIIMIENNSHEQYTIYIHNLQYLIICIIYFTKPINMNNNIMTCLF